jgi:ABC-type multidrug transport system ATPase subunit
VLLATHQTEEALELCDRLAIMDRGRLLAVGSATHLSREFGGERCRLIVAGPDVDRCRAVVGSIPHAGSPVVSADGDPGWARVELDLPGGPASMSALTQALAAAGVAVAGAARTEFPLSELIERVVHARGGGEGAHVR